MMASLLQALRTMLRERYVPTKPPFHLKGVFQLSDFESATLLQADSFPCIIINTNGETDVYGPFAGTKTRTYNFIIKAIARSSDPLKYRKEVNPYNVYNLTDDIRLAIAENKSLGFNGVMGDYTKVSALQPVEELDVMFGPEAGSFNARQLEVSYSVLENWQGDRNNQRTLKSPSIEESLPAPAFS